MSAKDRFHQVVKAALEKEGWIITHDPLTLRVDDRTDLHIDLGAEKLIAAERAGQKILTWQLLSMHQQMPKTPYLLDKSAFRLHSLLLPG